AYTPIVYGIIGFVGIVIVASLVASAVSFMSGRTDIQRAHRALSMSFWGTAMVGLLLLLGYSQLVVAAKPSEVKFEDVMAAPQGNWILAIGSTHSFDHHRANFLMDTSSGRFVRLDGPVLDGKFSADGKWAAWLQYKGISTDSPIYLVTLR